jgi:hypothetical protein
MDQRRVWCCVARFAILGFLDVGCRDASSGESSNKGLRLPDGATARHHRTDGGTEIG